MGQSQGNPPGAPPIPHKPPNEGAEEEKDEIPLHKVRQGGQVQLQHPLIGVQSRKSQHDASASQGGEHQIIALYGQKNKESQTEQNPD